VVTALCRLADLDATGAKGVTLADGRELVVVAAPDGPRAYVNSCPHMQMPLETFPDRFLTADRTLLICSTHGARFRVEDGFCISGPCKGRALEAVAVTLADEAITLA
jgi:nitrite reductase/ring-hydroxylating ferredoxin subunit